MAAKRKKYVQHSWTELKKKHDRSQKKLAEMFTNNMPRTTDALSKLAVLAKGDQALLSAIIDFATALGDETWELCASGNAEHAAALLGMKLKPPTRGVPQGSA